MELLIELALYGALIKVSLSFSRFLSTYDNAYEEDTDEYKIIKQGREVFIVVIIALVFLMLTDSIYSVITPFLWLGEVYSAKGVIIHLFNTATTLFFAINTFFACLMLYIIFFFYLDVQPNSQNNTANVSVLETRNVSGNIEDRRYLHLTNNLKTTPDDLSS